MRTLINSVFLMMMACSVSQPPDPQPEPVSQPYPVIFKSEPELIPVRGSMKSVGKWRHPPRIIVCDHALVDQLDLREAVAWWGTRGYPIESMSWNGSAPSCIGTMPWEFHAITIMLPTTGYNFQNYGSTTIYHEDGLLLGVTIEISDPRERVLEHELGHSLGWLHWAQRGHMMHPEWRLGGWHDAGLIETQ